MNVPGCLAEIDVGEETHIGAGTVTCNFDGVKISRSQAGNRVFIGSGCQLIAPVAVGRHAHVAAGSTITRDVPEDSLYVTRGKIVLREGWATRYRKIDEVRELASAKPKERKTEKRKRGKKG